VLELGDHAVRRHLAFGVAGGGDLELGAHHQRVLELALHAHRRLRDRAAVRRDEVHQPERQRLDARVGGDGLHLAQAPWVSISACSGIDAPPAASMAAAARCTSATPRGLGSIR
jgi:hypothetical protein